MFILYVLLTIAFLVWIERTKMTNKKHTYTDQRMVTYDKKSKLIYIGQSIPEVLNIIWYSKEAMQLAIWAIDISETQRSKASTLAAKALSLNYRSHDYRKTLASTGISDNTMQSYKLWCPSRLTDGMHL